MVELDDYIENELPARRARATGAIRSLIAMSGMSRREVALAAGLSPGSIDQYCVGSTLPSAASVGKLAMVFGVSPSVIDSTNFDWGRHSPETCTPGLADDRTMCEKRSHKLAVPHRVPPAETDKINTGEKAEPMSLATSIDVTREIVRLVDASGKTLARIADEMKISPQTLRRYYMHEGRPVASYVMKLGAYFKVHPHTIDPDAFAKSDSFPWCEDLEAVVEDRIPVPERPIHPGMTPAVGPSDPAGGTGYQVNPAATAGHVRISLDMDMSVERMSRVLAILAE